LALIAAVGRPTPGGAFAGNRPFTRRVGVNRAAVVGSEINLLSARVYSCTRESGDHRRGKPGLRPPHTLANPVFALVLRPNCGCIHKNRESPDDEAVRYRVLRMLEELLVAPARSEHQRPFVSQGCRKLRQRRRLRHGPLVWAPPPPFFRGAVPRVPAAGHVSGFARHCARRCPTPGSGLR
jgi:hypothetical protein